MRGARHGTSSAGTIGSGAARPLSMSAYDADDIRCIAT
jgi:hypothetical protein